MKYCSKTVEVFGLEEIDRRPRRSAQPIETPLLRLSKYHQYNLLISSLYSNEPQDLFILDMIPQKNNCSHLLLPSPALFIFTA